MKVSQRYLNATVNTGRKGNKRIPIISDNLRNSYNFLIHLQVKYTTKNKNSRLN